MRHGRGRSIRNKGTERTQDLAVKLSEQAKKHKIRLRELLNETLNFELLAKTEEGEVRKKLKATMARLIQKHRLGLSRAEQDQVIQMVLDDMYGYGPLEPIISDPAVSDIMINGPKRVFVERKGKLMLTNVKFEDDEHLLSVVERIVTQVGRRVDESSPMVDARMKDGSRFNAIIRPLSIDGAAVSIRRFGTIPISWESLVRFGSCPLPMMEVLKSAVRSKLNTIISGGTGSGKTTLLNVLSKFIPDHERIITIEDSAELQLQQEHLIRLETRAANQEGKGEINQRDLVKNSLRMRPDRIILGEIRGGEAVDMLTAMNTGCTGSLATVHSNSPQDALARFETMVSIGMPNMSDKVIRETIARALDVIVQQARFSDGSRRITAITEITGIEGNVITTQDIFRFEKTDLGEDGIVKGYFGATGIRPRFASRLAAYGIKLDEELFDFHLDV